ncbi:MAG: hypothetical protein WCR71_05785 [Bacteroidales bacterium]
MKPNVFASDVKTYKSMEELEMAEKQAAEARTKHPRNKSTKSKTPKAPKAAEGAFKPNVAILPEDVRKRVDSLLGSMEASIKAGKKVTLSDRMRALQAEGLSISDIAKIVDKPYRQVYSTLNHHKYIGGVLERKKARMIKKDEELAALEAKVRELEAKLAARK